MRHVAHFPVASPGKYNGTCILLSSVRYSASVQADQWLVLPLRLRLGTIQGPPTRIPPHRDRFGIKCSLLSIALMKRINLDSLYLHAPIMGIVSYLTRQYCGEPK